MHWTRRRDSLLNLHGDPRLAVEEWRRYRLIKDASRGPDELLAEGVALSAQAIERD
jgi:hypothetical protein